VVALVKRSVSIGTWSHLSAARNRIIDGEDGSPGQSRTADLRFRKPLLYPSELQGHCDVTPLSYVNLPMLALRWVRDLVSDCVSGSSVALGTTFSSFAIEVRTSSAAVLM
jgi:hypothetical protein